MNAAAAYDAITASHEALSFRRFDGSFVTFIVTARVAHGAHGFYMLPGDRRSGDIFLPNWRLAEAA